MAPSFSEPAPRASAADRTRVTLTYQWARELRRWHAGPFVGVHARIPDDEPVAVGRYNAEPEMLPASQAAAVVRALTDPRGWEIFVPRGILAGEVRHIRSAPWGVG
ncbi:MULTISPECIES: hypothetical protein [unclassified Pseudofrankia]|uniref:hypothetical protein n=1 Tax=unclassified Pseudofrankia TaxID=2994372 RepID=UPI0008D9DBAD|nr:MULTISPECIES: hypothetical protein [unclassified Pseudofrankia]MDT3439326.1 hypothetical protein [Pseudofrankia sp. BMG5.37]OHV73945.1 hypothetical protein BCD48_32915 [Pseudofrankia sp. BMG5.36]